MKGILEKGFDIRSLIKNDYRIFRNEEEGYPLARKLIGRVEKDVKMMTGWAGQKLYNSPETIEVIRNILKEKKNISVVFNKEESDSSTAWKKLKEQNPELCELKSSYPEQVKVYWTEKLPKQHYTLVDNKYLFFERTHINGEDKTLFFKKNDTEFLDKLNRIFDQYVTSPKVQEITNGLPID